MLTLLTSVNKSLDSIDLCSNSMLNSPLLKPLLEYACGGSDSKESACNAGDLGLIPEWEDPLEEGIATHSSILAWRITVVGRAWQATVHGVAVSQTRLRDYAQLSLNLPSFVVQRDSALGKIPSVTCYK